MTTVEDGKHTKFVTGDPVIDALEEKLARGEEIDLDAAFPDDGIDDDYTKR